MKVKKAPHAIGQAERELTTGIANHIITTPELRQKFKTIAGLCYALNCDISNYELENEELKARILYLETTQSQAVKKRLKKIETPLKLEIEKLRAENEKLKEKIEYIKTLPAPSGNIAKSRLQTR